MMLGFHLGSQLGYQILRYVLHFHHLRFGFDRVRPLYHLERLQRIDFCFRLMRFTVPLTISPNLIKIVTWKFHFVHNIFNFAHTLISENFSYCAHYF